MRSVRWCNLLFHKGENVARLKIARARQQEALLQFRQSLLDAGNEVNNALILWQTARKRLGIDRKQILNLKAAVWNTKLLMKYGRTHYLEVLTAQQKLLQAELAESEDRYDEIQGVITLYHALRRRDEIEPGNIRHRKNAVHNHLLGLCSGCR